MGKLLINMILYFHHHSTLWKKLFCTLEIKQKERQWNSTQTSLSNAFSFCKALSSLLTSTYMMGVVGAAGRNRYKMPSFFPGC